MEAVRSGKLDNICEGIAEERSVINAAQTEEKSLISTALQVMQQQGITVYKHGGIELVRVPGADKLRVRQTKDHGDASVAGGTEATTNVTGKEVNPPDAGAAVPDSDGYDFDDDGEALTH